MPRKPEGHSSGQPEGMGGGIKLFLAKDKTGTFPLMARALRVGAGTWARAPPSPSPGSHQTFTFALRHP